MKHFYLIILLLVAVSYYAKAQPPPPSSCTAVASPNISISGSTSFTFGTLSDFNSLPSSNAIQITVTSKNTPYILYIAGVITASAAGPNTVIPINTFTASASKNGSAGTVTLSNLYLPIASTSTASGTGKTDTQTISITLNPTLGGAGAMNNFLQAPGTHTLTLYFYVCN